MNPHALRIVRARLQAGAWARTEARLPEIALPQQADSAAPRTSSGLRPEVLG
ncbi:hypothetical protein [Saccharomonospora sp. CUA-673]|uniref:hypothetical protein n=1 Tax=Saccharomonospora sp. CUA-673 TaxID=1904969 RepID=UPI001300DF4D|nr:hypothetical protein [Saccharomonospora sp. CUA-673]